MAVGSKSLMRPKKNSIFSVAMAICPVCGEILTILGVAGNSACEICPVCRSQNRTCLLAKATIKILPSGDQLMLRIFFLSGCCLKNLPVCGCQQTICPLFEPAASHSAFGDQRRVVS